MRVIFNCISKSQGRHREVGSEGSETANPRVDEQKSRIRPRIRMSEPKITKSTEEGFRVNEAIAGRRIGDLPGEACISSGRVSTALCSAMGGVRMQESAEGIVVRWHS